MRAKARNADFRRQSYLTMNLLTQIRKELKQNIDLEYKAGSIRFFKEKINPIGVCTPVVRKIAAKYFPKNKTKKEVFSLCEKLLDKRTMEETTIAFAWARKMKKDFVVSDFKIFENWLKKYVDNWAFCDDFCAHSFGDLLSENPMLLPKVKKWTDSKKRWLRRASAVILINPMMKKKKAFLKDVFWTADKLLQDPDDMVQKGYGWMLKVASNNYSAEVFKFVLARKNKMPRTALRYAIEKYPKEMRKEAMS